MKVALSILIGWCLFVALVFGFVFDYFSSSFYSIGPSPTLYIIGINYYVDNWFKYSWFIVYVFTQSFIVTLAGDSIYPWINAVVLNPQAKHIEMSKQSAFCITNLMYLTFNVLTLFSTGISMSQLGFFISSTCGSMIAGAIISAKCLMKKEIKVEEKLENVV